jgi:predicted O-methyltransferase YrrM
MELLGKLIRYGTHRIRSLSGSTGNPFVRSFMEQILHNKTVYPEFGLIEAYRSEIKTNNTLLETPDPGTGSRSRYRVHTLGSKAKAASVNPEYGRLLFRLARAYNPEQIMELGTGVGISTLYMAYGNPGARIITVEGNKQLAEAASGNFTARGLQQITLINDTFDHILPELKRFATANSLVYIDGNHTFDATIRYFNILGKACDYRCIMVLDDINWSGEMARAWKIIADSGHPGIVLDLLQVGIIFLGSGDRQQKFWLRY